MKKKSCIVMLLMFVMLFNTIVPVNAAVQTEGLYMIESALDSNKVIDVNGGSKEMGANIQLYTKNGTDAQIYSVKKHGNYYVITCSASNYVLDIQNGSTENGANVQQWELNHTKAQLWILEYAGDGYYYIKSALGRVLDVSGGLSNDGTNIQVHDWNGTDAQKFKFVPVNITVQPEGLYMIESALDSNKVIDVSGGSKEMGANIQLYTKNGTDAQVYKVIRYENYYIIICVGSNSVLDIENGSTKNEANVQQWELNYTKAQLWILEDAGNGYYYIKSALGRVLDVSGGLTSNGTNIQVHDKNGTDAQKFKFVPVNQKTTVWPVGGNGGIDQNNWPKYNGSGKYHSGIDISAAKGTPVYATYSGTVETAKTLTTSYGKHVIVKCNVNNETVYIYYAHLNSYNVKVGDIITAGQQIGTVGNTGNSSGSHLHYEVRNATKNYGNLSNPTLNPYDYLPNR